MCNYKVIKCFLLKKVFNLKKNSNSSLNFLKILLCLEIFYLNLEKNNLILNFFHNSYLFSNFYEFINDHRTNSNKENAIYNYNSKISIKKANNNSD